MKVVCVIQARMGSTRLPGKVLMPLGVGNEKVLDWVYFACARAANVDEVVIATSINEKDDAIRDWCAKNGVKCISGSEDDVLSRFMDVLRETEADVLVRVTADEPFLDFTVLEQVIGVFLQHPEVHYCSNVHPRTYPDGLDVEVFSARALILANGEAKRTIDRECVTSWMVRHPNKIAQEVVYNHLDNMKNERWVLDTQDDYSFCCAVARNLRYGAPVTQASILKILDERPSLRDINAQWGINERFLDALDREPLDAKKELEGFLFAGSNKEIVDTIDKLIELRIEEHERNRSGAFR